MNSKPSLFNPQIPVDGAVQADSSGTTKMNMLSRVFTLEKLFIEELNKIRQEIEDAFQRSSEQNSHQNGDHISLNNGKMLNGAEHCSSWQVRGFSDIAVAADQWKPLAVRNMPRLDSAPLSQQPLPLENMKGFSLEYLMEILGGEEWSPGVFYPATAAKAHSKQLKKLMKSKTFYCMDAAVEPFLPKTPGENGAKLTVFFRENDTETENMHENVPLFVGLPNQKSSTGERLFTYFGHYSQQRWSDKLDYDRVQEVVPKHVKEYWAEKLTGSDRPGWLQQAIMEHFWPMPKYEGTLPEVDTDGSSTINATNVDSSIEEAKQGLKDLFCEMAEWARESKIKAGLLKKENIMDAFEKEDAAAEPGLRFWWEYLQCMGFDRNFYYLLVNGEDKTEDTKHDSEGEI